MSNLCAGEAETNSSHAQCTEIFYKEGPLPGCRQAWKQFMDLRPRTQSIPSGEKSVLVLVATTPSAKVRQAVRFAAARASSDMSQDSQVCFVVQASAD